jgi:hypothetical protein
MIDRPQNNCKFQTVHLSPLTSSSAPLKTYEKNSTKGTLKQKKINCLH